MLPPGRGGCRPEDTTGCKGAAFGNAAPGYSIAMYCRGTRLASGGWTIAPSGFGSTSHPASGIVYQGRFEFRDVNPNRAALDQGHRRGGIKDTSWLPFLKSRRPPPNTRKPDGGFCPALPKRMPPLLHEAPAVLGTHGPGGDGALVLQPIYPCYQETGCHGNAILLRPGLFPDGRAISPVKNRADRICQGHCEFREVTSKRAALGWDYRHGTPKFQGASL